MDIQTSDEEDEDGLITKAEEEEEKFFKKEEEPIVKEDLAKCWLSRSMLVKNMMTPWFEDLVKGAIPSLEKVL
jgi:hypothetical protein